MHIIVMRQFEHNFCSQVGPCTLRPLHTLLKELWFQFLFPRSSSSPLHLSSLPSVDRPVFPLSRHFRRFQQIFIPSYFIAIVACRQVVSLIFVLMSDFFFFLFFFLRDAKKKENAIFCTVYDLERYLLWSLILCLLFFRSFLILW